MEKRAFLAILLSIAVITIYSALLPKPQHIVKKGVTTQSLAQTPTMNQQDIQAVSQAGLSTKERISLVPIEHYSMDTDKLKLTFSNLGGDIQEVYLKDYDVSIPGSQFLAVAEFNNLPFEFKRLSNKAVLAYEGKDIKVQKTFHLSEDSYIIEWELKIINLTPNAKNYNLHINNALLDLSKLAQSNGFRNNLQFMELSISLPDKVLRSNISKIEQKKDISLPAQLKWLGIRDRYFCSILQPKAPIKGYFTQPVDRKQVRTGIETDLSISANSSYIVDANLYVGPQDINILKSYNLGLEEIVNFGFFNVISQAIIKMLKLTHRIVLNWGLCIILLSILISIVLYPFTLKSLKSMKEMQMLQPEIEKLRTAYKDQPQKLNKEIMELYREHKINPLGGCLPLFLQIPVFFALYQALMRSIELRGASFLWIKDLSQPDRLFILAKPLPIIGDEINLLPILMLVAMFFQQKMSSQGNPSAAPEQQKMMMILMPILFGFIFYHFPSGLTLYWTCYTIISLIFQRRLLYIKKD